MSHYCFLSAATEREWLLTFVKNGHCVGIACNYCQEHTRKKLGVPILNETMSVGECYARTVKLVVKHLLRESE